MVTEGSFAVTVTTAPAPLKNDVDDGLAAATEVKESIEYKTYTKSDKDYSEPPKTDSIYKMIVDRLNELYKHVRMKVCGGLSVVFGGTAGWFASSAWFVTSAGIVVPVAGFMGFIMYIVFPPLSQALYTGSGGRKVVAYVVLVHSGYKLLKTHGKNIMKTLGIVDSETLVNLTKEFKEHKQDMKAKLDTLEGNHTSQKRVNTSLQLELDSTKQDVARIFKMCNEMLK
jgi:hypothetical protein